MYDRPHQPGNREWTHQVSRARTTGYGRRLLLAAGFLAAIALPGCTSDSTPPGDPTSPPPTPSAPSPSPQDAATRAELAALEAYRGMWAAFDQAGRAPQANPDDQRLAQYATGDALRVLVNGLASMRDDGLVADGDVVLSPVVIELSPTTAPTEARIEDCADTSNSSLIRADGSPHEDEPGGRRTVTAVVEDTGGGIWKVTNFAVRQVGTCS